jgi:hypothetical protein
MDITHFFLNSVKYNLETLKLVLRPQDCLNFEIFSMLELLI